MEKLHCDTRNINLHLFFLLVVAVISKSQTPNGSIQRRERLQVLASLPTSTSGAETSQLFLTSPSGKYSANLVRLRNADGSDHNDVCYIKVQGGGRSVWESGCASVSSVNMTCSLVFSDFGIELLAGYKSVWKSGAYKSNQSESIALLDSGDLLVENSGGKPVWKAMNNPKATPQPCGSIRVQPSGPAPQQGEQVLPIPQQVGVNNERPLGLNPPFSSLNQPLSDRPFCFSKSAVWKGKWADCSGQHPI